MRCRRCAKTTQNGRTLEKMSDKVIYTPSRDLVSSHTRHGKKLCSCSYFCTGDHNKQTSIDGVVQNLERRSNRIGINDHSSHWSCLSRGRRFRQEKRARQVSKNGRLLLLWICLEKIDKAWYATDALQSGTLYSPKKSFVSPTKMFLFSSDKQKLRRTLSKGKEGWFFRPDLGVWCASSTDERLRRYAAWI